MSNYVYAIVNKINLKLYFGSHSWEGTGLDPNYYGSGKIIKRAIEKYGKDNFIVYPIKFYDTIEECRKAEEELLTKYDISNNPYCYNLKNGAVGWTSEDMKGEKHPQYGKRGKDSHSYGRHHTDETRKKLSKVKKGKNNHMYGKRGKDTPMYGKHHTEDAKRKMSQANNYKKTPLVAIQKDTGKIRMFESQHECARRLNLDQSSISSCLKGRQKTCGGYTFKYIEQLESGIYEGIL